MNVFDPSFLLWLVPPFLIVVVASVLSVALAQRGVSQTVRLLVYSTPLTVVGLVELLLCPHFWLKLFWAPATLAGALATVVLFIKRQREADVIER